MALLRLFPLSWVAQPVNGDSGYFVASSLARVRVAYSGFCEKKEKKRGWEESRDTIYAHVGQVPPVPLSHPYALCMSTCIKHLADNYASVVIPLRHTLSASPCVAW